MVGPKNKVSQESPLPLCVTSFLNVPLFDVDFDFSYSRYDVANLVVYLGAHNIKTNEGERTSHKVIRLIKHKGFDQGTLVSASLMENSFIVVD